MIKRLIVDMIRLELFERKWRRCNRHNKMRPVSVFPLNIVTVGKGTYGRLDVETYGAQGSRLIIGNYCSIARDVRFLCDGEHDYFKVSTYPFQMYYGNKKCEAKAKGPIIVEDDVWIGERSLILSGVTIGQGAIIAAGSIVYKNVPSYAIYASGKVLKYRFEQDIIEKMQAFDYSQITDQEEIKNNCDLFYSDIEAFLKSEYYLKRCRK